jgi:D-alanyl-D-alanine dipeptidase
MLLLLLALAATGPDDLVEVRSLVPDLVEDLRYATKDNFLHEAVYPAAAPCLLRRGAAERLARVAAALRAKDGTRLVALDCYRPHAVQVRMWELFPRKGYVAPPQPGSVHNRGGAIDVGLADAAGHPLPMPSAFDEFSHRSWASWDGGTAEERGNRDRLRAAMLAQGFRGIRMEWWHFEDPAARGWPVLDVPLSKEGKK